MERDTGQPNEHIQKLTQIEEIIRNEFAELNPAKSAADYQERARTLGIAYVEASLSLEQQTRVPHREKETNEGRRRLHAMTFMRTVVLPFARDSNFSACYYFFREKVRDLDESLAYEEGEIERNKNIKLRNGFTNLMNNFRVF